MQKDKVTYGSSIWKDYKPAIIGGTLFFLLIGFTIGLTLVFGTASHQPTDIKYLNYTDGVEYHRVGDTQVYIIINDNGVVSVQEGNRGYSFVIPQVQGSP